MAELLGSAGDHLDQLPRISAGGHNVAVIMATTAHVIVVLRSVVSECITFSSSDDPMNVTESVIYSRKEVSQSPARHCG